MVVQRIHIGGDRNFGYCVADEGTRLAALIDPSYDPHRMVAWARDHGHDVRYVLVTHDHHDHTNGNARVKELTGAEIVLHRLATGPVDVRVDDGDVIELGALRVTVLHTPGHHPTAVCYYVGDVVFTGDTLFVGKVGGTDLGEGARQEYDSLHGKVMRLPDDTRVLPGHDVGTEPESTIARERSTNPFLLQPSFDDFVDLKRNWVEYKRKHGIA